MAHTLADKLASIVTGLFLITDENTTNPWMLFEAGAIALDRQQSRQRVCVLLFGVTVAALPGPYRDYQVTQFEEKDMLRLVVDINNSLGQYAMKEDLLRQHFKTYWPDLHNNVMGILQSVNQSAKHVKPAGIIEPSCGIDRVVPEMVSQVSDVAARLARIESKLLEQTAPPRSGSSNAVDLDDFRQRTRLHHDIMHQARDLAVTLMGHGPIYSGPRLGRNRVAKPHPQLTAASAQITSLLEKMSEMFQLTVPKEVRIYCAFAIGATTTHTIPSHVVAVTTSTAKPTPNP